MSEDLESITLGGPGNTRATRRICLFGLGSLFQDCHRQIVSALGQEPDCLCDNAPAKWGQSRFGVPCISPSELSSWDKATIVVICVRNYEVIFQQLREMGFTRIRLACFDRAYDALQDIKTLDLPLTASETSVPSLRGIWTLVTGASRGIGRQIALEMARLGAHIIAHSRELGHTENLVGTLQAMGVQARSIAAKLDQPEQVEEMLDDLERCHPPIDIAFNNAGISLACGLDPWNISSGDHLQHYTVNALAPIRICYRLIPPMIRRGFGRVINVSSTIQNRPGEMAYACSKAALDKFVHDLAPSLKGTGVTISLVCHGFVRSDMGGPKAPLPVESVIPGVLLGALTGGDANGRFFMAQDYAGLSIPQALDRSHFYYGRERKGES